MASKKTDIIAIEHRHAVKKHRIGQSVSWVVCSMSLRILARNNPHSTLSLASDMAVSTDTIKGWAKAYQMYLLLRKVPIQSQRYNKMLFVRRALTVQHFRVMSDLWAKYEFSLEDAAGYLVTAAEERTSASSMQTILTGIYAVDSKDEWITHLRSIVGSAIVYKDDFGLPVAIRDRIVTFILDISEICHKEGISLYE